MLVSVRVSKGVLRWRLRDHDVPRFEQRTKPPRNVQDAPPPPRSEPLASLENAGWLGTPPAQHRNVLPASPRRLRVSAQISVSALLTN